MWCWCLKEEEKKQHRYAARIEKQIKSRKKRAQLNLALVKIREKCSNDRRLPTLGGVAATAMHLTRCKMNKNFASFFSVPSQIESNQATKLIKNSAENYSGRMNERRL